MKSCPKCGHENPDENKFCAECGAELAPAAPAEPVPAALIESAAAAPAPAEPVPAASAESEAAAPAPKAKEKPIYKQWWLWALAAFVVFIVVATIAGKGHINESEVTSAAARMSKDDFVSQCGDLENYYDLMHNPAAYNGKYVSFWGTVSRVDTSKNVPFYEFEDFMGNTYAATDFRPDGSSTILQGDYIEGYGVLNGQWTFTDSSGGTTVLPNIDMIYGG